MSELYFTWLSFLSTDSAPFVFSLTRPDHESRSHVILLNALTTKVTDPVYYPKVRECSKIKSI